MSKWFKKFRYSSNASIRLFCFPYAGGNAGVFENWAAKLDEDIDVFGLQAPGRANRFTEEPISCIKTKCSLIYQEILPYIDKPFVFFGHSNGAMVAFELSQLLTKRKKLGLTHLFLSAKRAPHLPRKNNPIHSLEFNDFIEKLSEFDCTPKELLNNVELMKMLEPMLRADFALSEKYCFKPDKLLNTPVTVYGGTKDEDVPKQDLLAWQDLVSEKISFKEYAGGHFFINHEADKVLHNINTTLRKTLHRTTSF